MEARDLAANMRANECHAIFGIEISDQIPATAIGDPGLILQRRIIATHRIGHELIGRVLAGLIAAIGHVTIKNAGRRRIEGFSGGDHSRGIEHLDFDLTGGHGLHFLDELRNQPPGGGFRRRVVLDAKMGCLGGGGAGEQRQSGGASQKMCNGFHVFSLFDSWVKHCPNQGRRPANTPDFY